MPTNSPKIRRTVRLLTASLLLLVLVGCVTESRKLGSATDENGLPQEVLRVPQQMQDLSGDLLRYHAKHRVLPSTLELLVKEQFMSAERYSALPDYLYSPSGTYKLRDGRMVILVDSEIRVERHAWCIVREPNSQPRSIQLNVTPVALTELEAAARRSR
ncbi:MAG: hypothetical protein KTR15_05920 [Phycisphaeraceae bacterium]|nr:hypothetical protein [Phycisphaeraceae bacterium]